MVSRILQEDRKHAPSWSKRELRLISLLAYPLQTDETKDPALRALDAYNENKTVMDSFWGVLVFFETPC